MHQRHPGRRQQRHRRARLPDLHLDRDQQVALVGQKRQQLTVVGHLGVDQLMADLAELDGAAHRRVASLAEIDERGHPGPDHRQHRCARRRGDRHHPAVAQRDGVDPLWPAAGGDRDHHQRRRLVFGCAVGGDVADLTVRRECDRARAADLEGARFGEGAVGADRDRVDQVGPGLDDQRVAHDLDGGLPAPALVRDLDRRRAGRDPGGNARDDPTARGASQQLGRLPGDRDRRQLAEALAVTGGQRLPGGRQGPVVAQIADRADRRGARGRRYIPRTDHGRR
jgi:hypothetical protein